jgi:hypothetical protein
MINLSALSTATTTATALSNLILVSPQQDAGIQAQTPLADNSIPPKFLFQYCGEQAITLKSDITDHFIEDNTALQDQVALRPELYSCHGFIGELNDVVPEVLLPVKAVADKLTVINAYVPGLSISALLVYNTAFQAYQVAQLAQSAAISAWTSALPSPTPDAAADVIFPTKQNKQQRAFQFFYAYWKKRTLFTVQTPWAIHKNMALETVHAVQDADTRLITDFELTFKQIRIARTQTSGFIDFGQGRQVDQFNAGQAPFNAGTQSPPPALPLGSGLTNAYPGLFP